MDQVLRTIRPPRYREFDDAFFFGLCQANETTKLERDTNGNIMLMPPTGSETGWYSAELSIAIGIWSRRMKLGYVVDSSAGFKLPDSAVRLPNVAWVGRQRWDVIPEADGQGFAPLCPN